MRSSFAVIRVIIVAVVMVDRKIGRALITEKMFIIIFKFNLSKAGQFSFLTL